MSAVSPRRREAAHPSGTAKGISLLLLGGSSEIALAIARRLVLGGPVRPFLLGRDPERLAQALTLLESVGCVGGEFAVLDADDLTSHAGTVAGAFERAGGFDLVVLATERPRASNPVYGAAKAGLDALAQGLADATARRGVRVLVVRPGFVTTRMTEGLKPAPLATTAEDVAEATVRALSGRAHTVWVPGRLRPIFAVLRHLPRALYRRLPL